MSNRRDFRRGPSAYKRGKPRFVSSGKAILIVTEGEKTEPNYFKVLRDRLQLNATEVEIMHPQGTDPITLTRKAIELRETRKKQSKKDIAVAYDEVWVVFDLEKPHDQRRQLAVQATQMREAAGISFAISDPCFEFWLLLHEEYSTAPFDDCDATVRRLKVHWQDYGKGRVPTLEFIEKLPTAVRHACRCRKHHEDTQGDGNPSSDVDRLCRSLNSATRPHRQFDLT